MAVLSLILVAALAVANVTLTVLFFAEKRRSDRRYNAMLEYVNRYVEDVAAASDEHISDAKTSVLNKMDEKAKYLIERINFVNDRYDSLAMDYTQAQEAAYRINDFGSSLASIFDYDPMKAIQKGRTKEAS